MPENEDERLEERAVEVDDPALSPGANERLTEEARLTVGAGRVRVPVDRPHASHGEPDGGRLTGRLTANRVFMGMGVGTGICVGVIIVMLVNHWWATAVAVVVLLVVTFVVVQMIMALQNETEHPDPSTVALLNEEGIRDPDRRFTELVDEFTPATGSEDRTTSVEDDQARATAEQRTAVTPSGGPSKSIGPES